MVGHTKDYHKVTVDANFMAQAILLMQGTASFWLSPWSKALDKMAPPPLLNTNILAIRGGEKLKHHVGDDQIDKLLAMDIHVGHVVDGEEQIHFQ